MKILHIACNPRSLPGVETLREVTSLQRVVQEAKGERADFIPMPELHVEDLPGALATYRPDVLHITAHSDDGRLKLADRLGEAVELGARHLRAFLDYNNAPRLVYINSCNSVEIAGPLSAIVPQVIGSTASITNDASIASARVFYTWLLSGSTIAAACTKASSLVQVLDPGCSLELFSRPGHRADIETLHQVPRIVARFSKGGEVPTAGGYYDVEVGVSGCLANTHHLILYTDDETFEKQAATQVIKSTPVRGRIWSKYREFPVYGDYRIFASGISPSGNMFSASGSLCEALREFYDTNATAKTAEIERAIATLEQNAESEEPHGA